MREKEKTQKISVELIPLINKLRIDYTLYIASAWSIDGSKNTLNQIHVSLKKMDVAVNTKLLGSAMRLLEVLKECRESNKGDGLHFQDQIDRLNNRISTTPNRNQVAMNADIIKQEMSEDQLKFVTSYLETLNKLILKYKLIFSQLFLTPPDKKNGRDTIESRILFMIEVVLYLYKLDVEATKESQVRLLEFQPKTQIPTILRQMFDDNLLTMLEILKDPKLDVKNRGSLAYEDNEKLRNKYTQELYQKLLGRK